MLGLPKSTEFNRRIPKQKFYENIDISPILKRVFVDQIKIIYWRNKIAPTTVNIAPGEKVTEIEVFEIKLTDKMQPEPIRAQSWEQAPGTLMEKMQPEPIRAQTWVQAPGTLMEKVQPEPVQGVLRRGHLLPLPPHRRRHAADHPDRR